MVQITPEKINRQADTITKANKNVHTIRERARDTRTDTYTAKSVFQSIRINIIK